MIVSYLVGGRDAEYAMWLISDLRSRLASRVQLTSDGHRAYLEAAEGAVCPDVDYAQLLKVYGNAPETFKGLDSPAECTGVKRRATEGCPDKSLANTSYVERASLTMQMHMRRFTRLINGFSKKVDSHAHTVALHIMYYNFVRVHKALKVTPAMAAGLTDRPWNIAGIVKLIEKAEADLKSAAITRQQI